MRRCECLTEERSRWLVEICMRQKRVYHNFVRYPMIFRILSPANSPMKFQAAFFEDITVILCVLVTRVCLCVLLQGFSLT